MTKCRPIKRNLVLFIVLATIFSAQAQEQAQSYVGVYKNVFTHNNIAHESYLRITSDSTASLYGNSFMIDGYDESFGTTYFVAPLAYFHIEGDVIMFSLFLSKIDLLNRPIDLSIHNTAEAAYKGYEHNSNSWFDAVGRGTSFHYSRSVSRRFALGLIREDGTIWLNIYPKWADYKDGVFEKIK